jgi:hypothetical protein
MLQQVCVGDPYPKRFPAVPDSDVRALDPVTQRRTPPRPRRQDELRRRYFRGANGEDWEVFEAPLPAYDRRSGFCLIFESRDIIRRVRNYPSNWYDLSEGALRELSSKS